MISPGEFVGPYEVLGILGAGGMGEVYRARDVRLGRFVALKVLRSGSEGRSDFRERLRNEARAVARLNHPHICTLYDIGSVDDLDYLVMEYVAGDTLATVLGNGRVRVDEALTYATEIADALRAAHDAGVLHRDLKPPNVMITPQQKVKVLDFGIAKLLPADADKTCTADLTEHGLFLGTLSYAAPEVLRGCPADARSDIWSFGATLHEIVGGQPLFKGRTAAEIICAVLENPLGSPPGDVPRPLQQVIERCLQRNPASRFQTASEVNAALKAVSEAPGPSSAPTRRQADDQAHRTATGRPPQYGRSRVGSSRSKRIL